MAGNCMMPSRSCKSDNVLGSPSCHVCQALASCKLCKSLAYQVLLFCPKLAAQQAAELPALQEPLQTSYASCQPGPALHDLCAAVEKRLLQVHCGLLECPQTPKNSFPSQGSVGPGTLRYCQHLADVSSWQVWYQMPAASLCWSREGAVVHLQASTSQMPLHLSAPSKSKLNSALSVGMVSVKFKGTKELPCLSCSDM